MERIMLSVRRIMDNFEHYCDWRKKGRDKKPLLQYFEDIHNGKVFTQDELLGHPYWGYLQLTYKAKYRNTERVNPRCLEIMKEGAELYNDIKQRGLVNPLEMWMRRGKPNIYRGLRRVVIAGLLGIENVDVRVYKDRAELCELTEALLIEDENLCYK